MKEDLSHYYAFPEETNGLISGRGGGGDLESTEDPFVNFKDPDRGIK